MDKHYSVGRYLSFIHRMGQCYISSRLGKYNIGSGQYSVLLLLSKNDGVSQETLSDMIKMDKATVGRAVRKLEDCGYVKRVMNQLDRRAYKIYITQKGRNILPVIKSVLSDWMRILLKDFSEEDKQMLVKLLSDMCNNLSNCMD